MKRIFIALCVIPLLPACQQEVLSRHDSLSDQFAQMNKSGWAVDDPNHPHTTATASPDPNVRVIREADFSGYQFRTSFQRDDDPRQQPGAPAPAPSNPPAGVQPAASPWGVVPASSGH